MDGPCPVARDQAIQVSDGSLKREYAREARAYWKEDSRQEVAVHTYAVAITRGTALCRGSLDARINHGAFINAQFRKRAWTRRMLTDSTYAEKVILENLMHFNAQGHCYSYTLKRYFS